MATSLLVEALLGGVTLGGGRPAVVEYVRLAWRQRRVVGRCGDK